MSTDGWIGVDLDGTLAYWDVDVFPEIGLPLPAMVDRVKAFLADGRDVRIFTARVGIVPELKNDAGQAADAAFALDQTAKIERWCQEHLGQVLPVTATKDFHMVLLYDDRCVQMVTNTGEALQDQLA